MTNLYGRRQLTNLARLAFVSMLGCSVMLACSDDEKSTTTTGTDAGKPDTGTGADTSTAAPDVAVRATTTYAGALKGPVLVTLFPTPNPTAGPPAGTGSNETPTWPGSNMVDVKNVTPGKYFAFAYIMTGGEHRQGPSADDPKAGPVDVTVTATATATVTLQLTDPPPPDAGDGGDAGDAADGG